MAASISFFLTHWMPRLLKLRGGREGDKGGTHKGTGVALTHRRAPADAASRLTDSGLKCPGPRGPNFGGVSEV